MPIPMQQTSTCFVVLVFLKLSSKFNFNTTTSTKHNSLFPHFNLFCGVELSPPRRFAGEAGRTSHRENRPRVASRDSQVASVSASSRLVIIGQLAARSLGNPWERILLVPPAIGCGSKLNRRGYAGFGPCFHLPGIHFGTGFLSHSQLVPFSPGSFFAERSTKN